MVNIIESPFKNDGENRDIPELILDAKQERDNEDQLFEDINKSIDKWYGLEVSEEAKNLVPLSNVIVLKKLISENKKVKRYNSFGKGNPENYWDFFEMFDFICYLRSAHPESIKSYLNNYKGGKYSR